MTLESPAPIDVGTRFRHYEITGRLGKGGMGEVFVAHDTQLGRDVAVKVLPAEVANDSSRLRRFETEARALAALNHPNIVSVFAIEEYEGRRLLVMELVEGRTLREFIRQGGLPSAAFFHLAASLADAVGAAHDRGVLHRDLKPENIMVTKSGRVKILDFGLAKFRASEPAVLSSDTHLDLGITLGGVALGTAPYMSPEQAEGEVIDQRSDLFSLGVVFYEMLTGAKPFRGRTVAQLLTAIMRDDPPPLRESRSELDSGFADVIDRCLRKKPDDRFSSGVELHAALRRLRSRVDRDGEGEQSLARLESEAAGAAPVQDAPTVTTPGSYPGDGGRRTRDEVDTAAAPIAEWWWRFLGTRRGLTAVLVGLGIFNYLETHAEDLWSARRGAWLGYDVAAAFSWVERGWSFERHDLAGPVAVHLGSIAYFFMPAALLAATLLVLVPRRSVDGYRIFTFAIVVCYTVSLPFYLLLPVPERWAFPESQAFLLSDLWSTRLIELIRPISGLDNCFPSFHVSGTTALVLVWYVLGLKYRLAIAFCGAAVALSTLLLGIHWIPDVVAGVALGVSSVPLAQRMNAAVRGRTV